MLHIKNITTKWLLWQSRKVTSVCTEDVDCTGIVQQIFWEEINKWLFVLASHRRCCLCNEVTPTEEAAPLATGFYNLQPTI
jgi:hypothetical protein